MNFFYYWNVHMTVLVCWPFLSTFFNLSSGAFSPRTNKRQHYEHVNGGVYSAADLAVMRSRPHYVSSSSPARPYSLSINAEDYHYTPKPKHMRPARLLRVIGPSFDPFWMSIERPSEVGLRSFEGEIEVAASGETAQPDKASGGLRETIPNRYFNFSVSPELTEGAARYQRKLEKEAEDFDLSSFATEAAGAIRSWLVRSATCKLSYQWVDLGPVFWPRWLRHTDCQQPLGSQSCSFPSGMSCRQAQVTQIKILAWHCWDDKEGVDEVMRTERVMNDPKTGVAGKRCLWRQVPYPVVTACKCSCK